MALTAGKRLQQARELMMLGRPDFSEMVGIRYIRLVTVENDRGRMSVEDLELIVRVFPELIYWVVVGEELDVTKLKNSKNEHIRRLADNLETHGLPEVN